MKNKTPGFNQNEGITDVHQQTEQAKRTSETLIYSTFTSKVQLTKRNKIQNLFKHKNMNNLLYTIAILLVIAWAIGYLGYNAGGLIHILLVIAVIAIVFRIIKGEKLL